MSKRILLCLSHSIEEYDQLKLLHGLGYGVASIGGYIDPAHPHDPKRPALDIPCVEAVKEAVDGIGSDDNLGAAQRNLPAAIFDWLGSDGVIIYHHYLERLFLQWNDPEFHTWRQGGGRVIWRTVGQSVEQNERTAYPFRAEGLEIIRYSPKERSIPGYAGENALIRFYKDPDEWCGWTGEADAVVNVSQGLLQRHPWTNAGWFRDAVYGLPTCCAGPGTEDYGEGVVTTERMKEILRTGRCYAYSGTQPASYTLGLLEAGMTGIPIVSIGPSHMKVFPYGPDMFEGHELSAMYADDPADASKFLRTFLEDYDVAASIGQHQRWRLMQEFGIEPVGRAWKTYLG